MSANAFVAASLLATGHAGAQPLPQPPVPPGPVHPVSTNDELTDMVMDAIEDNPVVATSAPPPPR